MLEDMVSLEVMVSLEDMALLEVLLWLLLSPLAPGRSPTSLW